VWVLKSLFVWLVGGGPVNFPFFVFGGNFGGRTGASPSTRLHLERFPRQRGSAKKHNSLISQLLKKKEKAAQEEKKAILSPRWTFWKMKQKGGVIQRERIPKTNNPPKQRRRKKLERQVWPQKEKTGIWGKITSEKKEKEVLKSEWL